MSREIVEHCLQEIGPLSPTDPSFHEFVDRVYDWLHVKQVESNDHDPMIPNDSSQIQHYLQQCCYQEEKAKEHPFRQRLFLLCLLSTEDCFHWFEDERAIHRLFSNDLYRDQYTYLITLSSSPMMITIHKRNDHHTIPLTMDWKKNLHTHHHETKKTYHDISESNFELSKDQFHLFLEFSTWVQQQPYAPKLQLEKEGDGVILVDDTECVTTVRMKRLFIWLNVMESKDWKSFMEYVLSSSCVDLFLDNKEPIHDETTYSWSLSTRTPRSFVLHYMKDQHQRNVVIPCVDGEYKYFFDTYSSVKELFEHIEVI